MSLITGRCMYVWKLLPVVKQEMGIKTLAKKAKLAKLSAVWIKIAEGNSAYANVTGQGADVFKELVQTLNAAKIRVWGWHIPFCRTKDDARSEADLVAQLARDFDVEGVLMDAESEAAYFKGDKETADIYAASLRQQLNGDGKGLGISSHDIPSNFPGFPFDAFAQHAQVNAPQVYYGASSSVANRLDAAVKANSHLKIDFCPVGAGWIGGNGGCSSASACAERAVSFMNLVRLEGFPAYSFWHWGGAPSKLWEVLFDNPV